MRRIVDGIGMLLVLLGGLLFLAFVVYSLLMFFAAVLFGPEAAEAFPTFR